MLFSWQSHWLVLFCVCPHHPSFHPGSLWPLGAALQDPASLSLGEFPAPRLGSLLLSFPESQGDSHGRLDGWRSLWWPESSGCRDSTLEPAIFFSLMPVVSAGGSLASPAGKSGSVCAPLRIFSVRIAGGWPSAVSFYSVSPGTLMLSLIWELLIWVKPAPFMPAYLAGVEGSGDGWQNRSLALPLSDRQGPVVGRWAGRQVESRLACLSLSFLPSICRLSQNCWTLAADGPHFPEVFECKQWTASSKCSPDLASCVLSFLSCPPSLPAQCPVPRPWPHPLAPTLGVPSQVTASATLGTRRRWPAFQKWGWHTSLGEGFRP